MSFAKSGIRRVSEKQVTFMLTKKKGYLKEVSSMAGKSVLRGVPVKGFTEVCSDISRLCYQFGGAERGQIATIRTGNFRVDTSEERRIQHFGPMKADYNEPEGERVFGICLSPISSEYIYT